MKTKILIAGGGTAGWVTAAVLCKGLPQSHYQIELIDSEEIAPVGVGEASIPPILQWLSYLEVSSDEFINQTAGSYKYGIEFCDWGEINQRYMHAFGSLGTHYKQTEFSKLWLAYAQKLGLKNLIPFSPTAVAAYKNKFSEPVEPTHKNPELYYPLSHLHYAFHFDAGKLANYLKTYALRLGCQWHPETIEHVQTQGKQVKALILKSGRLVKADYFVDCTGQNGLISKQALQGKFNDWSDILPCDRAIVLSTPAIKPIPPYTKSMAMSAGWRWQIPLANRTGNGYVYSSQFISDGDAKTEFAKALQASDEQIDLMRSLSFQTGFLSQAWQGNCIAQGLAAGFAEPLESTSIHLIYKYAIELKNAFIYGTDMQQEANRFNRKFTQDMLDIRDFLMAHYIVTQRSDSEFWRTRQTVKIPPSLTKKLNEFSQLGEITLKPGTLFSYYSWFQILIGQGFLANQNKHPIQIDTQGLPDLQTAHQFFTSVYQAIDIETESLHSHASYLRKTQCNH
ncbi:tryptophan halogenase family protein [Catenovulum sediminis]|uniref:tryptophan halogenase family protein n=1 Tax=Catenovulum sediminis TaxID=1740262 RepID=UPI00117C0312|nr:tryptophan halogenase family protein [Catenovulum sediminis]